MDYADCEGLRLELMGAWRLHRHGVLVHVAARQQRLVAALAVKGPSLRSCLVGLLWPEHPDRRALESLRVSVHILSRQVPNLIVNDGPMLSLSHRVEVDLHSFQNRIHGVQRATPQGHPAVLVRDLRRARLLPGWYDDWVICEQVRLQQDCLRACTMLARQSLDEGQCETAGAAAEAALEIEPLSEEAVRILIAAELRQGNAAAAVRTYQGYQNQLHEEMGLQPSESLTRVVTDALGGPVLTRKERSIPVPDSGHRGEPQPHHWS
jgi:DNA-binding SARP family transcriptional activator